jgi:hypothetical protein
MSHDVRDVADAILHEGYLLYPYRRSALKNCHRHPFGTLYPKAFCEAHRAGDASSVRLECVAVGAPEAKLSGELRCMHFSSTQAVVRTAQLPPCSFAELATSREVTFEFALVRGALSIQASALRENLWKLCIDVANLTPLPAAAQATRDQALACAMASTHLLLSSDGGEFVSLIDPPESARELAESCRNVGLWPVLAGRPGQRDRLLAAPIILYDYPQLAEESPGDFFDGTEIDELLTLRVLTLTDAEKCEMAESDVRARALLDRTEAAGLERLGELHGRMRTSPMLCVGACVLLRPVGRADIFDLALAGKRATVQAIERDLEGRSYVAVTIDDDPGKDLGMHAHRFFFRPEELELL